MREAAYGRAGWSRWMRIGLVPVLVACDAGPAGPPGGSGEGVLFIGNSLTYANDLPEMVRALAAAAGEELPVTQVANPDYSLEDHWADGAALRQIRRGGWSVVVLQQGPSALPESRELLLEYARRFAVEIRAAGARPALYMVWPSTSRSGDFDRVSESYRLAAEEVDGLLFPVGEAWRAAWRRGGAPPLYSIDGLHPTPEGSYAAALVIYARLSGRPPVGMATRLPLGTRTLVVAGADVALLQEAAAEANAAFGR